MDCPSSVEEATAVIEDEIEDWIFIANDTEEVSNSGNPYTNEGEGEMHQSAVKEFFLERKEDLKHIKEEAKNLIGKVKGVFKKKD